MAGEKPDTGPEAESFEVDTLINCRIGERLLELRRARRMTLVAVAKQLGISYQQVQKYERGSSSLSVPRLYSFAQIYEIAPFEFFRDLPMLSGLEDYPSTKAQDFARSPEGRRLLAAVVSMPAVARRALLDLLQSMPYR